MKTNQIKNDKPMPQLKEKGQTAPLPKAKGEGNHPSPKTPKKGSTKIRFRQGVTGRSEVYREPEAKGVVVNIRTKACCAMPEAEFVL